MNEPEASKPETPQVTLTSKASERRQPRKRRRWLPLFAIALGLLLTIGAGLRVTRFLMNPEISRQADVSGAWLGQKPIGAPAALNHYRAARALEQAPVPPAVAGTPVPVLARRDGGKPKPAPAAGLEASLPRPYPNLRPAARLAYPFDVRSMTGERFALKQLRGKTVVAILWLWGCGACEDEIPQLEKLKQRHAHDGTVFLSFANNTEAQLLEAQRHRPYPFPVVADPEEFHAHLLGAGGFPTHVVIDPFGRIVEGAVTSGSGDDVVERIEHSMALAKAAPRDLRTIATEVDEGRCELRGALVSELTGEPVQNGWVQLTRNGFSRSFRTDAQGRFAFTRLGCARYSIEGHSHEASPRQQEISVSEDQSEIKITLPPLARIEGTVTDPQGTPVTGARVDASCRTPSLGSVVTDATGHFVIERVPAESYVAVVVTPPGAVIGAVKSLDGKLRSGETTTLNLESASTTLSGRIAGAADKVLLSVNVNGEWCGGNSAEITPAADGTFSFQAARGSYHLQPFLKGRSPWDKSAQPGPGLTVDAGGASAPDLLVTVRGGTL
jgi:hypothetical protein